MMETVDAQARGETIDPYFENHELEWFTKRSGVHKADAYVGARHAFAHPC